MHSLEHIVRINSPEKRIPHPLRLHPRIWALRQRIRGMTISSEYMSSLYYSLYKYAYQIVERPIYHPDEGWDDLEALQQVTMADWVEAQIGRHFAQTGY